MSHPHLQLRPSRRTVLAAMAGVALSGTRLSPALSQESDPIRVVASFSVLADIVQQVGGDLVEVASLVPAGGDAHTFDPSPDQVRTLEDADLIVSVGGDFEPWLDNVLENVGDDTPRFEAFLNDDDHDHEEEETAEDHEDHDHDEMLHPWLDAGATIAMIPHLAERLAEVDPDNTDSYTASGDAYIAELEELDIYITEQTESILEEQRNLITVHRSMDAFADAYGYEIPAVLLESHSTEGADAPAGHIAELVEIISEHDIPAVFPDTPGGADMLDPVAAEAGVEIAPSLYVDTLEADEPPQTYVEMMRHNIDTIVAALAG